MKMEDIIGLECLPSIPKVEGLEKKDHITFIASHENEEAFFDYCWAMGLYPLYPIITEKYPAKHIGYVRKDVEGEPLIGFSTSKDENSPIQKSLSLYGTTQLIKGGDIIPGKLQHIAYEVDQSRSMEDVCKELEDKGVKFMTPILRNQLSKTQLLEQRFVACNRPYGEFIEIIKRSEGSYKFFDGRRDIQVFASEQIDELYRYYDNYSKNLLNSVK